MDVGILKSVETRAPVATQPDAGRNEARSRAISSNAPVALTAAKVERTDVESAVAEMQSFVQSVDRDIDFKVDDESGRVVINVTEKSTGEIIRQIPSEEALRLAESLSQARSLMFRIEV